MTIIIRLGSIERHIIWRSLSGLKPDNNLKEIRRLKKQSQKKHAET